MRTFSLVLAMVGSLGAGCALDDGADDDSADLASEEKELGVLDERRLTIRPGVYSGVSFTGTFSGSCPRNTCVYPVAVGMTFRLTVDSTFNRISCMEFDGWTGGCSHSFTDVCDLTIDESKFVSTHWRRVDFDPQGRPCRPK